MYADIRWSRSVIYLTRLTDTCMLDARPTRLPNDAGSGGENPVQKGGDYFQLER